MNCPAPKYLATSTLAPTDKPIKTLTKRLIREPVEPTAARLKKNLKSGNAEIKRKKRVQERELTEMEKHTGQKRRYEIDMCNGPLFGKILLFSLPLMLGFHFLQTAQQPRPVAAFLQIRNQKKQSFGGILHIFLTVSHGLLDIGSSAKRWRTALQDWVFPVLHAIRRCCPSFWNAPLQDRTWQPLKKNLKSGNILARIQLITEE